MLIEYRIRFEKGGVVISQNINGRSAGDIAGGGDDPPIEDRIGGSDDPPVDDRPGGEDPPIEDRPGGGDGLPDGVMAVILGPVILGRAPAPAGEIIIKKKATGLKRRPKAKAAPKRGR